MVSLQVRRGSRWPRSGVTPRPPPGAASSACGSAARERSRAAEIGSLRRRVGRLNVFRSAHASWYGPGLYGNRLGCGGRCARPPRRRAQVAALRHEGHAPPPRAHHARAGDRPRPLRRRARVRPHRGDRARLRFRGHGPHPDRPRERAPCERCPSGTAYRLFACRPSASSRTSTATRSTRRSSCCAGPSCSASRSSWPAPARARSSRRPATRRASTASAPRCRPRARAGCAPTRSSSRPTSRPTARPPRRVWELVGGRLDHVQQIGVDEAYADLTGVERPLRVLRELVASPAATGIMISVGVGPSRLVAKCCSDLGKPAGFVAMGREEACVRFATAPTSRVPRDRPQDRRPPGGDGPAHGRPPAAAPTRRARRALRRRQRALAEGARGVPRRLAGRDRAAAPPSRVSTETTFDADIADHGELEAVLRGCRASCARGSGARGRARAHDRHQGPARRLDDGHPRPHGRGADQRRRDVTEVALELLRAYAPPRPVRLLGVRVAAFEDVEPEPRRPAPAAAGQLALDGLVQRGGELAARLAGQRMLDAELVEHADHGAAQVLAALVAVRRRSRRSARRGRARCSPASSAANASRSAGSSLEPDPGGEARRRRTSRRRWRAAPAPRSRSPRSAAAARARRRRRRGRARARARGAGRLAAGLDQRVGLGGHERVEEALDARRAAGRR